ncbi:putative methyltransferase-like protein 7A isoform X1 [Eriocheir sinensis]|uniref:putative methyltransferase-like protein 7A isoform X1 n=1 Tax=Eriocheir sinensis TaxID=95602 RepID=UPI0021C65E17|nr:putative methyltransferase-like protein 7A isoform X1 [Eriocheir sinensis]
MEDEATSGSWVLTLLLLVACVFLLLWKGWPMCRERFFAAFMDHFNRSAHDQLEAVKRVNFASLRTAASHDPELRRMNALRVLEVGVGTGTNFAYYPDGTHLVAVEPNPHFKPYYDHNRHQFPNIQSEEVIVCSVEEMDMVESSSVDVVVSTFVFCSVTNTKKVLQQILRVLVPGGRFYFYEHIAEFDTKRHATRRKAQELLSRLGIWPFIFAGCMVNRDMLEDIQQAGFSKVQAQRFCSPFEQLLFQMVKPSLMGMAQKGEAFAVKSYTCPGTH